MPLGWIAAFAVHERELSPGWVFSIFLASLVVAAGSLYIIVSHEIRREQPFR